jgi:hypothetical protein
MPVQVWRSYFMIMTTGLPAGPQTGRRRRQFLPGSHFLISMVFFSVCFAKLEQDAIFGTGLPKAQERCILIIYDI